MNKTLVVAALAYLGLILSGCGSKQENLTDNYIDAMEDMRDTLQGVTDSASAKSAVPRIREIAQRLKQLGNELDTVEKTLSEQEREDLHKTFQARAEPISEEIDKETRRIGKFLTSDPEVLKEFIKAGRGR